MPITARQRLERRKHLGASDSAAVLGLNPHKSAYDVWLEKTYETEPGNGSEAMEMGNDFERPVLQWAARELGVKIRCNVRRVHPLKSLFAAHLDAAIIGKQEAIEAKVTSSPGDYGEPGTDECPEHVLVQVAHQMFAANLSRVWIAVLAARFDRLTRTLYRVDRNEELIDLILQRGEAFWREHVERKTPPPDTLPSLEILKRIRRQPQSVATVAPELAANWSRLNIEKKWAEAKEKTARAALLAAAGDAELITYGGPTEFTFFEQGRAAYQVAETKFRVLRERSTT